MDLTSKHLSLSNREGGDNNFLHLVDGGKLGFDYRAVSNYLKSQQTEFVDLCLWTDTPIILRQAYIEF